MSANDPAREADDPLLRARDVARRTGLSASTIHRKRDPASPCFEKGFPLPYRIGPGLMAWRESELQMWLESVRVAHVEVA